MIIQKLMVVISELASSVAYKFYQNLRFRWQCSSRRLISFNFYMLYCIKPHLNLKLKIPRCRKGKEWASLCEISLSFCLYRIMEFFHGTLSVQIKLPWKCRNF